MDKKESTAAEKRKKAENIGNIVRKSAQALAGLATVAVTILSLFDQKNK